MLSLIFDTETTGLFNFGKLPGHSSQPEVIQLCAKFSQDGKIVSSVNVFVRGEKPVEEKAFETHRISREFANDVGISRRKMCLLFQDMAESADEVVGHNVDFDVKMLMSEMIKEGGTGNIFQKKAIYCTMKESTNVCKIPSPKRAGQYKWPSLAEAYAILVDPRGFDNAHDAEADVLACHEVFRVLRAA